MKKHLLTLCIAFIAFMAYGQNSIPNGNFETWNTATYDYPQNYPNISNAQNFFRSNLPFNVTKTTDAYHGVYAVELTTNASATDTAFGYFINVDPGSAKDPSQWTGGMPYSQKPAGIRGYYKYNVATADSATIIVAFSKAGSNIGTYFFKLGGIHTSYTLFNLTFSPALSVTPDSVIFGVVSCKISSNNKGPQGPAGSTLIIDSVSFTGVSSQPALMNGDFESWQSQIISSPANWYLETNNGNGFTQTTDAAVGNYAIELKTYANKNEARSAQISTGYYPNNCSNNCNELGGYPFSNQVDTLAFYYKYIPSGNDSASINLNFKKNGSYFGWGGINLHASATYLYKEIPISLWQVPDTVMIQIQSSSWNDTLLSFVGSDLKIDGIHFKTQALATGIFNYKKNNSISVFPNPTTGKIQIQVSGLNVQSLEIFNSTGEKVYSTSNFQQQKLNETDLSTFNKGIYFMEIYDGENFYSEKIVVQ